MKIDWKEVKFYAKCFVIVLIFTTTGILHVLNDGKERSKSAIEPIKIVEQGKFTLEDFEGLKGQILVLEDKVEKLEVENENIKMSVADWNGLFKNMLGGK